MSRFTTYFKGSDGHLLGSSGDSVGPAFPQSAIYGTNTGNFPDSFYTADDGGAPILTKQVVFNNGTTTYTTGTLWVRFPQNSILISAAITMPSVVTAGTFAFYWERNDKSTISPTVLNGNLPTAVTSQIFTSTALTTSSGVNSVLRFDIAGILPITFNGSLTALLQYVTIPTND